MVNFIGMKYMYVLLAAVLLQLPAITTSAQQTKTDFKVVDDFINSVGPLDTLNTGTISFILTKNFPDSKDKVRAIFNWITKHITLDIKAARNSDNEKISTDLVLKTRKANAAGYAALFQDMCSVVKIRCLTVDGYAKYNTEQIGEKPDELNHTWAVVQLGQSPDTWFYVDPTWGSGYLNDKLTVFTKAYNDNYFFANRVLFNLQHFPDNGAWQLGPGPKSSGAFFSLPMVWGAAYDYGLGKFSPAEGLLKAKPGKGVSFTLKINTAKPIDIVALEIGEGKKKKTKTVDYRISGGNLVFTHKFEDEDEYPVTVLINNQPVLGYLAEISE